jgi:hypothetical protein
MLTFRPTSSKMGARDGGGRLLLRKDAQLDEEGKEDDEDDEDEDEDEDEDDESSDMRSGLMACQSVNTAERAICTA